VRGTCEGTGLTVMGLPASSNMVEREPRRAVGSLMMMASVSLVEREPMRAVGPSPSLFTNTPMFVEGESMMAVRKV